jgi:hypothetical protein
MRSDTCGCSAGLGAFPNLGKVKTFTIVMSATTTRIAVARAASARESVNRELLFST